MAPATDFFNSVEEPDAIHSSDGDDSELGFMEHHVTTCLSNWPTLKHLRQEAHTWSCFRRNLFGFFNSHTYDLIISAAVLADVLLIASEPRIREGPMHAGWEYVYAAFICFFVMDLALRLYVYRWRFFLLALLNDLDFVIITVEIMHFLSEHSGVEVPHAGALRMIRLAKLARAQKMLQSLPELSLMMRGMGGALMATFWGVIMIGFVLLCFAVLGVHAIDPVNKQIAEQTTLYDGCERCPRAYETVFDAFLTLVQTLVCGDGWGATSLPIIDREPITMLYFGAVFILVNLVLLNLILGLIVDAAVQAREGGDKEMAEAKLESQKKAMKKIRTMFHKLDVDNSGKLSIEEINQGYMEVPRFAAYLRAMDIHKHDMDLVCAILADGSGLVDYTAFAKHLCAMKYSDSHTMLVFIKHLISDVKKEQSHLHKVMVSMRTDILGCIDGRRRNESPRISSLQVLQPEEKKEAAPVAESMVAIHELSGDRGIRTEQTLKWESCLGEEGTVRCPGPLVVRSCQTGAALASIAVEEWAPFKGEILSAVQEMADMSDSNARLVAALDASASSQSGAVGSNPKFAATTEMKPEIFTAIHDMALKSAANARRFSILQLEASHLVGELWKTTMEESRWRKTKDGLQHNRQWIGSLGNADGGQPSFDSSLA